MVSFVRTPTRVALPVSAALALLVFTGGVLRAQEQGGITGEVREVGTLRPIVGAQVFIEGTTIGSLTNPQGRYLIPAAPAGEVALRVQLIGYAAQTQAVTVLAGETVTANFELRQTALRLDEVVVTGAGAAMERRRLGNTIATVDMAGLETAPVRSFSEIITAREPGVMGLSSGGVSGQGARIRIRGSASLSQSNEPIVYVDGVRVDRGGGLPNLFFQGAYAGSSRLDDINPDAIERIEILKGSAAATLYGTEAANGVIQIFTKRGQAGAPRFNLTIEQGFSNLPLGRFEPHAGFVMAEEPSARPHGTDIGTRGVRDFYGIDVQPFEVFEVNHWPEVFGTGYQQTYALSVTGGSEAMTYFVSGRYSRDEGPSRFGQFAAPGFQTAKDGREDRQFNANLEFFPNDDLRVRVSSNYIEAAYEHPDVNNSIFGVISALIMSRPELASENNLFGDAAFSTVRENMHRLNLEEVRRFGGAVTASYTPMPAITLEATMGVDFTQQRGIAHYPFGWNVDGFAGSNVDGWRTVADRNNREVTVDLKGTWSTNFGTDWTSELVVGTQGFLTQRKSQAGTGQEFAGPGLEVTGAGAIQNTWEGFLQEAQLGVLAQHQTGWRDFVFATVGARFDEHSAFGELAGGAFYPKASLSVIPSDLPGWNRDRISTLRLRGAVGSSGLQPGVFDQLTTFTPLAAETGAGVAPLNLGNPELKPEKSLEWEVGAEVGVLDDRLSLDVTYWNRTTTDALVDRQFPPSGGFRFPQLANIGQLDAWGFDIGAHVHAVARPNFSATFFANAARLDETITDLGGAPPLKVGLAYPRYRQFTMEGHWPGSFFGPVLDTSVEFPIHRGDCNPMSRAELLDFLSEPRNPSAIHPFVLDCGTADMLLHFLGKPFPDWQGTFGGNFTFFGDFSLNTLFEFRGGNFHVHDLDREFRRANPIIGRNLRRSAEIESILLNPASTPEQRLAAADEWAREIWGLSPYDGLNSVHEADFIRLREISLTYRPPADWATRLGARTLSFTLSGRNLALWTKFPGRDPEINVWGRGLAQGGLSENWGEGTQGWGVPLQRRFTFQVRAGF